MAPAQLAFEATLCSRLPLFPGDGSQLLGYRGTTRVDLLAGSMQDRNMVVSQSDEPRRVNGMLPILYGEL